MSETAIYFIGFLVFAVLVAALVASIAIRDRVAERKRAREAVREQARQNELRLQAAANHRQKLLEKYNDEQVVDLILKNRVWKEQTKEQLVDSIGHPAAVDEMLRKSGMKLTWKYGPLGGNRFTLRVTLEDGLVTGWSKKGSA